MEGEHTHSEEHEQVPIVTPVVNTGGEVVQPVIDHASKIATLEERQSQYDNKLFEEISKVRSDLSTAIEESTRGANERVAALENRLGELLARAAEVATPSESTPAAPEVEVETPAPQVRYIRRNGRKVKVSG